MDAVEEVKNRLDIVEVISSYIPLKKSGRNYSALCPFHAEKTPSFMVTAERQAFKCFGCFPKGALIKTPAGLHPIELIKVGDYVISGKGRPRRVLRTHKRYFQGRLIEVTPRKLAYPTSLTEDHQVFTLRTTPYLSKYKNLSRRFKSYDGLSSGKLRYKLDKYFSISKIYAGELSTDNYLLYPIKQEIKRIESIDLSKYLTLNPKRGKSPRLFPFKVLLDEDFLKLLGYYLAEGSSHRAYIRFSLGGHEIEFAEEIVHLIKSVFNLDSSIHFRKGRKAGIEVTCCNSFLANIFENMCGKGAANKHIDYSLEVIGPKTQKVLVDAVLKGDGTARFVKKSPNRSYSVTTISKILAEQIVDILLRNEIFPSVGVEKEKIDKRGVTHKKAYTITWYEKKEENYHLVYEENDGAKYWILPIRKIEQRPFKGTVYNFAVDEDHSYVAGNFAVGNCGEGGDVFSFVEKMEGWDFKETLVELAKKAGVEIKEFKKSEKSDLAQRLVSVNKLALKFYSHLLIKHKLGEEARKYLASRGIKKESFSKYNLGYAPRGWENVYGFLKKRGFTEADLAASGLVISRSGGKSFYDRFRGRIIFPIRDNHGEVVGFSGRVIGKDTNGKGIGDRIKGLETRGEPKYVNSPETPIFHKGSLLFGLDVAKEAIRRREYVVLVEGEFDAISLNQAGVENVVASKGTALTERQIAQLKRLAENVALCFDTDLAGDAASRRGIEMMDAAGMNIKVIKLGKFKDPDEFVREDPKGFKKAIRDAVNVYDYFIESASKRYNLSTSIGKKNFGREILPVISKIADDVMRAHYLTKISSVLGVEVSLLAAAVKSPADALSFEKIEIKDKPTGAEKTEKYFLALYLAQNIPEVKHLKFLELTDFTLDAAKGLWKWLNDIIGTSGKPKKNDLATYLKKLPENLSAFVDELYLIPISPDFADRELSEAEIIRVGARIKQFGLKRKLNDISKELYLAEKEGSKKMIEKLNLRFQKVSEKIKEVKGA